MTPLDTNSLTSTASLSGASVFQVKCQSHSHIILLILTDLTLNDTILGISSEDQSY